MSNLDQYTTGRLLEFFGQRTPWYRALWSTSFLRSLEEVLETSTAVGTISDSAFAILAHNVNIAAGRDPLLQPHEKQLIQRICTANLKKGFRLRPQGRDYFTLQHIINDVRGHYLSRWADHIESNPDSFDPEQAAVALSSHLLDAGFSSNHLHRWLTYHRRYKSPVTSLPELFRQGQHLLRQPPKTYEVLIAFANLPLSKGGPPTNWLTQSAVKNWFVAHGITGEDLRCGALQLSVEATDTEAACGIVLEQVEALCSRTLLGSGKRIDFDPSVWIAGEDGRFDLKPERRRVSVKALFREDNLALPGNPGVFDAAIGLLSHLDGSGPGVAVAAGWAAIEALLGEPDDRGAAADRMAQIVACSYPRAELTALSYSVVGPDRMKMQLRDCQTNHQRALCLAKALARQEDIQLSRKSIQEDAAIRRLGRILLDPAERLAEIEAEFASTFRHLYRQRNLVLHSARMDAKPLRACLRVVAPLVGAGMDRLAHAFYVNKTAPLELAAKARISLKKLASAPAFHCASLLE